MVNMAQARELASLSARTIHRLGSGGCKDLGKVVGLPHSSSCLGHAVHGTSMIFPFPSELRKMRCFFSLIGEDFLSN